uniref:Uncharacterized protein n=1 Tax=Aegilops tauschii subsp. strangulata TaxID=200361 RepID=A0A453C3F7_AEGTS
MHSRDVFSPTPWHQGGRVRREQQYMVVSFNFLPPRCFHSLQLICLCSLNLGWSPSRTSVFQYWTNQYGEDEVPF